MTTNCLEFTSNFPYDQELKQPTRIHNGIKEMTLRRTQIVVGVTALTLASFSAVPELCATESSEVGANSVGIGQSFDLDQGARISLPLELNISENLNPGVVTKSSGQAAEASTEANTLAQELANPIPTPIFAPFQANEDFGYGPSHNGYRFTLNIQPIVPISITEDWKVFVRTIIPVISQHDLFYVENVPKSSPINPQNRSQDGLSDTTQSFFFSPKKPGPFGLIWGIGPAFLYPTGTHPLLDTGTFSIGPTLVVLKQTGPWTAGALMNQLWSVVISEDRKSVSQMFLQPLVAYTTKTHTTFTLSTESTANWNNTPGDAKWNVPIIFQIGQIFKIGSQPIAILIGGKYYADSPRYGPDWGVRFNFILLYPRAKSAGQAGALAL